MDRKLDGKVAIITGAGGGFGEGIARLFAAHGAKVGVFDIRGDAAQKVAADIGVAAMAVKVDVTSRAEIEAGMKAVAEAFGTPDILVNNAAIAHTNRPLSDVDEATFDRMAAVNMKSIFLVTQAILPHFTAKGTGAIINIGSTAGVRPRPGLTWYNATKGFVNTASQSMAVELAPKKIRVNAILPVMGETGLLETFLGKPDTPENRAQVIASIPLGRLSRPLDIARAALFLASEDAEFLTGILLPVDGGRTI